MFDFSVWTQKNNTGRHPAVRQGINVGQKERWASLAIGSALLFFGLKQRSKPLGIGLTVAAGEMLYRGSTGHCPVYTALDVTTADAGDVGNVGIRVEKSITINKSAAELYQFWRNLENLPQFMEHLVSVQRLDNVRSHWVAKAPMGKQVSWNAEIINDVENRLIAWKSLPNADVDNVGSVNFEELSGGRGTVVRVLLEYSPPAGVLGATVAKLFHEDPAHQVEEDLRRLKRKIETGEIATTKGQPRGRRKERGT